MARIVVFTGELNYSVRAGICELDRVLEGTRWLIVCDRPNRGLRILLRNQWRNVRRNGPRWLIEVARELWSRILPWTVPPIAENQPGYEYTIPALEARTSVRIIRAPDIHASAVIQEIREFAPDLGVSLAAPILRAPLFDIPRLGTVNLHKGKVPEFRGMPPAFWELWFDEKSIGCTLHRVDAQLDHGDVVEETEIPRHRYSTLRGLQLTLDHVGILLTCEAVQKLLKGAAVPVPQRPGGRTNRKPTLAEVAALRRRMDRAGGTVLRFKSTIKDAYFSAAVSSRRLLGKPLRTPKLRVLLYHRVTDETRDNLTVGIEQFDRQMAMLRRCCDILSVEEVLELDHIPRTRRPLVCVTFDDGYKDNFEHAVPILLRHGVPAAFFVSTQIVSSGGRFPHDIRRGNPPIPMMSWDDLRAMQARGFTIGSHTANHVDCGAESDDVVLAELEQSKADLTRELGNRPRIFAYPYGGVRNMTSDRLMLVKRVGYVGCLSAYGGVNENRIDRFNVLRGGINYEFSDAAFRFAIEGLG